MQAVFRKFWAEKDKDFLATKFAEKVLLMLLMLSPPLLFSQDYPRGYYAVAPIRIKPFNTFNLGKISYHVVDVVDLQNNQSIIGDIYEGAANLRYQLRAKKGLERNFNKFFKKAFKYTEKGERKIVVAFKKLSVTEKKENLGIHGGRLRNYEIEVEYYESKDSALSYLYTDYQKVDSLSRKLQYNLNRFCFQFFKTSFAELDGYLNAEADSKKEDTAVDSLIVTEIKAKKSRNDSLSGKLRADYVKENFTFPPKVHYVYNFEQFYGSSLNGIKFNSFAYLRTWDKFECTTSLAFDFSSFSLHKRHIDDSKVKSVDYIYVSLGIGSMQPLNNFFITELSAKLAVGSEILHRHSQAKQNNTNTLLGLQLQQKLHFMLGRGFGLSLNVGTYEFFSPTTRFMKTDFGFQFGIGLKV